MNWKTFSLCFATALASPLPAADWTQFRGPLGNGLSAETTLPAALEAARDIAWKIALPGRGLSSPIIIGDRIIVTSSSGARQDRLHVLCFNAADGAKLWERTFRATGRTMCHPKTCNAAPTPSGLPAGPASLRRKPGFAVLFRNTRVSAPFCVTTKSTRPS